MLSGPHEKKGKWESYAFQDGIMDAVTDPLVEDISVMGGNQWGKSEIRLNITGYYMHYDPMPIIAVDPSLTKARNFTLDRLNPMIEDTPVLNNIVQGINLRKNRGNSMLHKTYPGGPYTGAGANSPASLSGDPKAIAIVDDMDRCGMTKEGDASELAFARTRNFRKRKRIAFSTPTVKGKSNIEKRIARSDRRMFFMPCRYCAHEQIFRYEADVFKFLYDRDDKGGYIVNDAWFECEDVKCKHKINERDRNWMINHGHWVATNPKVKKHAGFCELGAGYIINVSMIDIAQDFLNKKDDPEQLQVHINLMQGHLFEEKVLLGKEPSEFKNRIEDYEKATPEMIKLTWAVDVQDKRLECQLQGWNKKETWILRRASINGDHLNSDTWERLYDVLREPIEYENGFKRPVDVIGIDTGFNATAIYPRIRQIKNMGFTQVYALKGWSNQKGDNVIHKKTMEKKYRIPLITLNVDRAKDIFFKRLEYEKLETDEKFPEGYVHFNHECNEVFFAQLLSEIKRGKYVKGIWREFWEKKKKGDANEALDLTIYNMGLIELLEPINWKNAQKRFEKTMNDYLESKGKSREVERTEPLGPQRPPRRKLGYDPKVY